MVSNSESLEKLVLWNVTGITDEDMTHLFNVLVSNTTLKNYISLIVTSLLMESNISVKDLIKIYHWLSGTLGIIIRSLQLESVQ